MAHRRYLLEKNLLYLFSEDGNIEYNREDIGFVNGGLRLKVHSTPEESRFYSATGDRDLLGERVFSGSIVFGVDAIFVRQDDVELLDVKIAVQTDDGAVVDGEYTGVFYPGPRTFRQVVSEKPKLGTEQRPAEGAYFAMPRFYASDPKYAWLNGRQCLAIGRVQLIDNVARQASSDIWIMD
jgi:hypothetical protein